MSHDVNRFGQPIGSALPEWQSPDRPAREPMQGRFCRVEPLEPAHAADLYAANALDPEGKNWTYLPYGPFDSLESYLDWLTKACQSEDPLYFAIVDQTTNRPVGIATYMRIDPANGVIEVGGINYSPLLQRTPAATEAMYLMMHRAFEMGYRRYEWKCDSLNAPSRAAAQRLGFVFEGVFRQAVIYKGRTRDTAWYSVLDTEWPARKDAFERWLDPTNFDEQGHQRLRLADLT